MRDVRKANCPRPDTDQYLGGGAQCRFEGLIDDTMRFVEDFQLLDEAHWKRFVEQFRIHSDIYESIWPTNGWRGEYWGKMMRGACFVYAYTRNPGLYRILTDTVLDMMSCAEESGRISSYIIEDEFTGWDIWCRKYVLLGMQYYLEICQEDDMAEKVVACMKAQADYIMSKIGYEEGKKPITRATGTWRGLNSSSLLEPIVRLYNITEEEKYLSFAEYIVNVGGTSIANIFKLAYENKFYPYQYPVTKAYEMTSCFEGLLEFYRVRKEEWQKTALIHFADRILESDFTIIGSSGCTNELFDHSTVRQANTTNEAIKQETCVTVTLMKFFYQMTLLTGKAAYADAFERSLYNAYLGAVNTQRSMGVDMRTLCGGAYPDAIPEVLPFDSYSPLTAGTRGIGIGGSLMMPDRHFYGCCACIGSAGIGLVPKMALMKSEKGLVVNLYIPGSIETTTPAGGKVRLAMETSYPREGNVKIRVELDKTEDFAISLRNPAWSRCTRLTLNGESQEAGDGYIVLNRTWNHGDEMELVFDMRTEAVRPIPYGHDILMTHIDWYQDYVTPVYDEEDPKAKNHVALRRGPLVLAADSQFGYDVGGVFDIAVSEAGYVETEFPEKEQASYPNIVELEVPLKNGERFRVIDYASAGKLWNGKSRLAAWIQKG